MLSASRYMTSANSRRDAGRAAAPNQCLADGAEAAKAAGITTEVCYNTFRANTLFSGRRNLDSP